MVSFPNSLNEYLHYSTCLLTLLHPIHLQNHTIERLWVEINSRINYPIKAVLIEMLEANQISTEDPATQYCVSWFAMQVCNVGISIFVSWNSHPIPGWIFQYCNHFPVQPVYFTGRKRGMPRGVPDILMQQNNKTKKIPPHMLPALDQATEAYRNNSGTLTDPAPYGCDPLEQDADKKRIRVQAFHDRFPSFEDILHNLVNGHSTVFKQALLFYMDVTHRLSHS